MSCFDNGKSEIPQLSLLEVFLLMSPPVQDLLFEQEPIIIVVDLTDILTTLQKPLEPHISVPLNWYEVGRSRDSHETYFW